MMSIIAIATHLDGSTLSWTSIPIDMSKAIPNQWTSTDINSEYDIKKLNPALHFSAYFWNQKDTIHPIYIDILEFHFSKKL